MEWPRQGLAPALALFPPALGVSSQHRSLGDFCFMPLGASRLAAIRARSCSQLCWWECRITPAKSTQLSALRSHEPGFCTWVAGSIVATTATTCQTELVTGARGESEAPSLQCPEERSH